MQKKYKKILCFSLVLIPILGSFWFINNLNYSKAKQIQDAVVKHPENLPTPENAKFSSPGFYNLKADLYWLRAIQYIGGNAIGAEYKKYLFAMIDIITELNPYFEKPYLIGQLLIPSHNHRYEDRDEEEQMKHIRQAEALGLKGMKNFCDVEKVGRIDAEFDLQKIWTEDQYKNPCKSYEIPYYLAFVYYFYLNDGINAAKYYKVASANEDSVEGAKVLAAIMQGKGGDREKSFFMLLSIGQSIDSEDQVCNEFSTQLSNIGAQVFYNNAPLDGKLIRTIEQARKDVFETFDEENEGELLSDTKCQNYAQKAIRELNLAYIEAGEQKYFEHYGYHSGNAKQLFEGKFIDFLPTDFQQYEDYGIIYEFNPDTGNYDYGMGKY